MRTRDFEQRLMDSIANASRTSWWHLWLQKHHIRMVRHRKNTHYAERDYKRVITFEVPTDDSVVLMTVGETATHLDFYYFGIDVGDNSTENLNVLYERHLLMKALRGH